MELRNFLKCDTGFVGGVNPYLLEIHTEMFTDEMMVYGFASNRERRETGWGY